MIKIICIGKLKENYLKAAIEEYEKRLKKYTTIQIIELQDEAFYDVERIKSMEGEKIEKYIHQKDYVITLEIEGTQLTSENFAEKLQNIYLENSNIDFIIGGSYGLSDNIKNRSNLKLSFSKMTFPHQLFRVILLEQIYRAYKINNNEKYHK